MRHPSIGIRVPLAGFAKVERFGEPVDRGGDVLVREHRRRLLHQGILSPSHPIIVLKSVLVLRGRCGCNAVAYEVSDEFVVAFNCHCSNCRAMTGSAFLPWGEIEREKLRVTKGDDRLIVEGDPDARHAVRCG